MDIGRQVKMCWGQGINRVFFFKNFYQWMDRKRGVGKKEGKEEQSVKWTDCNDVFISMKKRGLNKKYKIEVK